MEAFAPPELLTARMGLSSDMLRSIGAIAQFSGDIEYRLEWAYWKIQGHDPKGVRHPDDGINISQLITKVEEVIAVAAPAPWTAILVLWCGIAKLAYACRNSIMHSMTVNMGGDFTWLLRNPTLKGEKRKRPYSDFHANEHTLRLLELAFSTLFKAIAWVDHMIDGNEIEAVKMDQMSRALRDARSVCAELADLAAAVNHEKY
jgi:hypothetical protein